MTHSAQDTQSKKHNTYIVTCMSLWMKFVHVEHSAFLYMLIYVCVCVCVCVSVCVCVCMCVCVCVCVYIYIYIIGRVQNCFMLLFDLCLYSSEAIVSKSLIDRVCLHQRFHQQNVLFYCCFTWLYYNLITNYVIAQLTFSYSKSVMKTREQYAKSVQ